MNRRSKTRGLWALLLLLALSQAGVLHRARAEESAEVKAKALAQVREGNRLLDLHQPEKALTKFEEAEHLYPSPKLQFNVGQAHNLIPGHEAQAYQCLSRFLEKAVDANPSLRKEATKDVAQLRAKVGLVAVTVDPADANVLVDDSATPVPSAGQPLVLGVGPHVFRAVKGSQRSAVERLNIVGNDSFTVRLRVAPPTVLPKVAESSVAPPPRPAKVLVPAAGKESARAEDGRWQTKAGVALVGLAAAGVALGVVETFPWSSKHREFGEMDCGHNPADAMRCADLRSDFYSARNLAFVGYGSAAVLAALGTYFLLSPSENATSEGAATTKSSRAPRLYVDGRAATLAWTF